MDTALLRVFVISAGLLFFPAYAASFHAEVMPSAVNPGDVFAVRVTGVQGHDLPAAVLNSNELHFSSCGDDCFIALGALNVDTEPGIYNVKLKINGENATLPVSVRPETFPVVHLTLPDEKVFLKPEDLKRAQKEAKKLRSIWPKATERLWQGDFILPLDNDISTVFGVKRIINKKKNSRHRGMDIKGKEGDEVKASNSGRVVIAEELFFGGNTVIIDHGQGVYTIYMHLSSFSVNPGETVLKGDVIGLVGSTGRATGPHLHFGLKVLGLNANPLSLINLRL